MRTQWLTLAPLAALAHAVSAQDTCPEVNLPKPSVVTLFASPTSSDEAIILRPDCTHEVLTVSSGSLEGSYKEIEHIESFPAVNRLILIANHLKASNFSSGVDMTDLLIGWNGLSSIDDFAFPANLRGLDLEGNSLSSIAKGVIPDSVSYLYLTSNKLSSLADIAMPKSLQHLFIMNNEFTKLDLPLDILSVTADGNPLSTFEKTDLPETLEKLSCVGCNINTIRGVAFPSTLKEFIIPDSKISNFEIRASDKVIFENLALDASLITQTECEDKKAEKVDIKGATFCVVTDDRFTVKYYRPATDPPATGIPGGFCGDQIDGVLPCVNDEYCQPWDPWHYQCRPIDAKCGIQETDVQFDGEDIDVPRLVLPERCCDKCHETEGCVGYTYTFYDAQCHLKKGITGKSTHLGGISATIVRK
ncbi:hypothetical protein Poli38472_013849 [Pythium oligandrum]|uniref:Apple domain-containing protein n=1 Tax=Pythium oligandrum TaxID=41045 RepID=A0A8K1C273_PYTOL|nr:hypothetical protein Poli38472_013849 [Pythium oligandrum]|eukprot:TMW55087.1 hypothetical protein Poli38472_013849 [Pythium oligandrum]